LWHCLFDVFNMPKLIFLFHISPKLTKFVKIGII
jgi:hypothetical protein